MMRNRRQCIVYSDKFRELVLRAYPDNEKIKELLDSNEYFLGRYLDDGCGCGSNVSVSADEIIIAFGTGQVNEFMKNLLERANDQKLKALAYKMWGKEWFYEED